MPPRFASSRDMATKLGTMVGAQAPVYRAATALVAGVANTGNVTILTFTPTVNCVIVGYNADFKALANARYRMRLTVGGTSDADTIHAEEVTTDANSWTPLYLSVNAGTVVRVQISHGEVTSQDIRATINYREG